MSAVKGSLGELMVWPHDIQAGFALTVIMSVLSIFGAFGIIYSFTIFPEERNAIRKLLLALTLGDCVVCLGNIVGLFHPRFMFGGQINGTMFNRSVVENDERFEAICDAEMFFKTFGNLISIYYNIAIPVYFYIVATRNHSMVARINMCCIHIVCLVFSFFAAIGVSVISENMAFNTPWCWVSNRLTNESDADNSVRIELGFMLIGGKFWEMFAYVLAPLFFYMGYYELYKKRQANKSPFASVDPEHQHTMWFREEDKNFLYVPPLYYFLRIWGTIFNILAVIHLSDNGININVSHGVITFLYIMRCIGDNTQAFTNFILFCVLDKKIRPKMFKSCCRSQGNEETVRLVSVYSSTEELLNDQII